MDSETALDNPSKLVKDIKVGFITKGPLVAQNVINDTHFLQRDRMGRLVTFLAIMTKKPIGKGTAHGIGADVSTAFFMDGQGSGKVYGYNAVWFVTAAPNPQYQDDKGNPLPLTYAELQVFKVRANQAFDVAKWKAGQGAQAYFVSATEGDLTNDSSPNRDVYNNNKK